MSGADACAIQARHIMCSARAQSIAGMTDSAAPQVD